MARLKGSKNKKTAKTQHDSCGKRIVNADRREQNRLAQRVFREKNKAYKSGFKDGKKTKEMQIRKANLVIDNAATPTEIRSFFKTKLKADLTPSLNIDQLRSLYVGARSLHHSMVIVQKQKNSDFMASYGKEIKSAFDALNKGALRKSLEVFVLANIRKMFSVDNLLSLQNSALTNSLNYQDIDLLARLTRVDKSGKHQTYMRGLIPSRATLQRASDHLTEGMDALISSVVCFDNRMCKLNVNDVIDELLVACDMGKHGKTAEQIASGEVPSKVIEFIFGCDESHLYEHSHFSNSVIRLANSEMLDKLFGLPWKDAPDSGTISSGISASSAVALDIDSELISDGDVMPTEIIPPEKRTWHKIHSVMACILLGFAHGREKLESMKILLSDIFAQMKIWGGQQRTYYCRSLNLHFNCKALCVNDMAQNWLVTQSGGGSHSTEYLCYCCWKTSTMRGRPSPYRCFDCIAEDKSDENHKEFSCHHVDILESTQIEIIEGHLGKFLDGGNAVPATEHWFAYCLIFPLGSKHLRVHREAFARRYLQFTRSECLALTDEDLKVTIRTWQMKYEVTYESCMSCSTEIVEENLRARKIRVGDAYWESVTAESVHTDAQIGCFLPETEENQRLLLKFCIVMSLKVGWISKQKRANALFYINELNPPCGMHFETRVQLGFDEALLNEVRTKLSETALKKFFEEKVDPLINEAFMMGDRIPDDVFLLRDDKKGDFRCQILNNSIAEFKLTAVKTRKLNLRMKGPRGLIALIRSCGSMDDTAWTRRFELYETIFDDLRTFFSIWHDSTMTKPDESFIRRHTLAGDRICRNWWKLHGVTKFGNYMEHIESGHIRQFMRWHGHLYLTQNQNLEGMMKLSRTFAQNRTGGNAGKGGKTICIAESLRKFLLARVGNQRAHMIQSSTGVDVSDSLAERRVVGKAAVTERGKSTHSNVGSHSRRAYIEATEETLTQSSMSLSTASSGQLSVRGRASMITDHPLLTYAEETIRTPTVVTSTAELPEIMESVAIGASPIKRTRLQPLPSRATVQYRETVGSYGSNMYTRVKMETIRSYSEYPNIGDPVPTCEENMALKIECTAGICIRDPDDCCNRRMQQDNPLTNTMFTRRRDGKRGYGMVATTAIAAETFLMEYCGLVIGEERCKEVLRKAVVTQKEQARSYVMNLGASSRATGKLYLDAKDTTHPCKYINHSCEPNCYAERWLVMGMPRIAVFTLCNVEEGEMLTFDYGWEEAADWPVQPCYCGSERCRQTLQRRI